jgi:hypothetical protein
MKKFFCLLATLLLSAASGAVASAQVSFYGDFSASKLTDVNVTNFLYGPTIGAFLRITALGPVKLDVDLRGSFLSSGGKRLDGVTVGPRFAANARVFRLKPYAEFMVGFARYNNGLNAVAGSTSDAEIQINGGVDRSVSRLFDWRVFEYGYSQYYGLGGIYNPKTFSTGIVFHLP